MAYNNSIVNVSTTIYSVNQTMIDTNYSSDIILKPTPAILIGFHLGQSISILCILFGTLGNATLLLVIYRSSFCRFPYGLFLTFIAIFDIVRLFSVAVYYLFQADIIPVNTITSTIYIVFYRYTKNVTNWLKVFLAIERIITIKYWITNRYNVHSKNTTNTQRIKQRRIFYLILLLLICALISQHPNFIPNRYAYTYIDPVRLFLVNIPNSKFYYGPNVYNGILYIILSYILIDDVLPITTLLICNMILFYKLRRLPLIASRKIVESIWILFFLTIFSIFIVPRSFIILWNIYMNSQYINDTIISVITHTLQGLEMMNHAITGYACFLSCHILRKTLFELFQTIYKYLQEKLHFKNHPSTPYTV
ncbi:hypothetical protein I4U23_002752 [Adineta vaga]|nr:hypothetical protein I4U23_002752 [Adineta vaga]